MKKTSKKGKNYAFVPAYYEWHFIDTRHPERVLLNWIDPVEDIFTDYNHNNPMTTFDEVFNECNFFVSHGIECFENGTGSYYGVTEKDFMQLPVCASRIMAQALYNDYIA